MNIENQSIVFSKIYDFLPAIREVFHEFTNDDPWKP